MARADGAGPVEGAVQDGQTDKIDGLIKVLFFVKGISTKRILLTAQKDGERHDNTITEKCVTELGYQPVACNDTSRGDRKVKLTWTCQWNQSRSFMREFLVVTAQHDARYDVVLGQEACKEVWNAESRSHDREILIYGRKKGSAAEQAVMKKQTEEAARRTEKEIEEANAQRLARLQQQTSWKPAGYSGPKLEAKDEGRGEGTGREDGTQKA